MTALALLALLKSDMAPAAIIYRDPKDGGYVLAEEGEEHRYRREGWERVGPFRQAQELLRKDAVVKPGMMLWKLMEDVARQKPDR